MRGLFIAVVLAAACGDGLGGEGDACTTSADCDEGLLCDVTVAPSVCSKMLAPRPDLAGVDLSEVGHDMSANLCDLSHVD